MSDSPDRAPYPRHGKPLRHLRIRCAAPRAIAPLGHHSAHTQSFANAARTTLQPPPSGTSRSGNSRPKGCALQRAQTLQNSKQRKPLGSRLPGTSMPRDTQGAASHGASPHTTAPRTATLAWKHGKALQCFLANEPRRCCLVLAIAASQPALCGKSGKSFGRDTPFASCNNKACCAMLHAPRLRRRLLSSALGVLIRRPRPERGIILKVARIITNTGPSAMASRLAALLRQRPSCR